MATAMHALPPDHTVSSIDVSDANTLLTTYQDYPPTQPFIHDTYRRQDKPVKAYPESNRQAVMSALKGLQDKIKQLEIERTAAESNLKHLADETTQYRDMLDTTNPLGKGEVQGQLHDTESRCHLLEKQLDYMRRMVKTAEIDRTDTIKRVSDIEQHRGDASTRELQSQIDKISELERDHLCMTATQTLAQGKIQELEEKLKEERHFRKLMQDQNSQLMTQPHSERSPHKGRRLKKKKKKSPQSARKHSHHTAHGTAHGREHYRLNLAELPFVAGKSTEPSHSLPVNLQQMLSLMKNHNVWLCNSSARSPTRSLPTRGRSHYRSSNSSVSSANSSLYSSDGDLADLLLQLQDEFGHMSFEHQELSRQIQEAVDPRLKDDLERELDSLVAQMEAKGDQIAQLRKHREKSEDKRVSRRTKRMNHENATQSTRATLPGTGRSGEVQVTTTIKTKGPVHVRSQSAGAAGNSGASLDLYKNLKKIQSSLRRDDLVWEC